MDVDPRALKPVSDAAMERSRAEVLAYKDCPNCGGMTPPGMLHACPTNRGFTLPPGPYLTHWTKGADGRFHWSDVPHVEQPEDDLSLQEKMEAEREER